MKKVNITLTPNKIVCIFISFTFIFIGYKIIIFGYNFTGDNYLHSEEYIVKKTYSDLDWEVYNFKKSNPEYALFRINEQGEKYIHKDYQSSKHFHVFFYFEDINLTIQCLLDPINDKKSLLSLYAISKGVNFASWKSINTNDLSKKENEEIKKKFEVEILDKLGKWKHKRWYN